MLYENTTNHMLPQPGTSCAVCAVVFSAGLGELHLENTQMARRIEVKAGDRYGRLAVLYETESALLPGKRYRRIMCVCDCGNEVSVRLSGLRSGNIKSCGCLHDTHRLKHGHTGISGTSLTYRSWSAMRTRCLNKNAANYHSYGGRGISICERWNDFDAFVADMGERPSKRHSIDRIDPNGNYEPGNCQWATPKQQARNRSNNRNITFNGETMCLAEWADRIGIKSNALQARLNVSGYTIKEALTLPFGDGR